VSSDSRDCYGCDLGTTISPFSAEAKHVLFNPVGRLAACGKRDADASAIEISDTINDT